MEQNITELELLRLCYNWVFYDKNLDAVTYNEMYKYVTEDKNIHLEVESYKGILYNKLLKEVFFRITNNDILAILDITGDDPRDTYYKFDNVIDLNQFQKPLIADEDIYIISLEYFHKNWFKGVSFLHYQNHIVNEKGYKYLYKDLLNLYESITKTKGDYLDKFQPKIASMESMLGLLEYKELRHSLEEAREAKIQAKEANFIASFAIYISIVTFVISTFIGLIQIIAGLLD